MPVGPLAMKPAAGHGDHAVAGSAYDRDAEERRRPRLEALVVVEQARHQQSRPGGDLGHRRVGDGRLHAARAAGVPELQLDHVAQLLGDLGAALLELGDRGRLELAYDERLRPLVGYVVRDAGHLSLVGHHPDQREPAVDRPRGRRRRPRRRRTAGSAWARRANAPILRPASMSMATRGRTPSGAGRLDQRQVGRVVDHQRDAGARLLVGEQVGQGDPVDRGVAHHHVVGDSLAHQPQRLAQGVGEHAGEPGSRQGPLHERGDAQRLGGDPHGLARRAAGEVGGVGVERVEVDDRPSAWRGRRAGRRRGSAGGRAGGARRRCSGAPSSSVTLRCRASSRWPRCRPCRRGRRPASSGATSPAWRPSAPRARPSRRCSAALPRTPIPRRPHQPGDHEQPGRAPATMTPSHTVGREHQPARPADHVVDDVHRELQGAGQPGGDGDQRPGQPTDARRPGRVVARPPR